MLSLLNDTKLHTKTLKELNSVNEQIDKCMECGFCEPVCPSRNLSLYTTTTNTIARKIQTLDD